VFCELWARGVGVRAPVARVRYARAMKRRNRSRRSSTVTLPAVRLVPLPPHLAARLPRFQVLGHLRNRHRPARATLDRHPRGHRRAPRGSAARTALAHSQGAWWGPGLRQDLVTSATVAKVAISNSPDPDPYFVTSATWAGCRGIHYVPPAGRKLCFFAGGYRLIVSYVPPLRLSSRLVGAGSRTAHPWGERTSQDFDRGGNGVIGSKARRRGEGGGPAKLCEKPWFQNEG